VANGATVRHRDQHLLAWSRRAPAG
jgi:hypothetical protein